MHKLQLVRMQAKHQVKGKNVSREVESDMQAVRTEESFITTTG